MRFKRCRLEFRMKLARHKPWMPSYFHGLHQVPFFVNSGYGQAFAYEVFLERIIEFIPVPVSLGDLCLPVCRVCFRPLGQYTWIGAKTHGSAHVLDFLLLLHQIYHGVLGFRIKLTAVCPLIAAYISREFHDSALHPQTDTKKRYSVF